MYGNRTAFTQTCSLWPTPTRKSIFRLFLRSKEEIQKYIAGIIRHQNQKLIAINSVPDHLHALVGMKPSIALSDLVRDIKSDSSVFINAKKWIRGKFNW